MRAYEALFAGLVLAAGIVYEVMARQMPRGKLGYPGPGFFPTVVGAFLVLTAAACLIQALLTGRSRGSAPAGQGKAAPAPRDRQAVRVGLFVSLLILYALTLQPLGFPIAIVLFLVAATWVFGYRRWFPALGIATGLAVLSYLIFVLWLKVPLPLGILSDVLD